MLLKNSVTDFETQTKKIGSGIEETQTGKAKAITKKLDFSTGFKNNNSYCQQPTKKYNTMLKNPFVTMTRSAVQKEPRFQKKALLHVPTQKDFDGVEQEYK